MTGDERPDLPLFVDSGGYSLLKIEGAEIQERRGLGELVIPRAEGESRIHPRDVMDLQERVGEVAFTLDFPIPEDTADEEARRRRSLSIANAEWALRNRRRQDLPLFGAIQGWDLKSYRASAEALSNNAFDGFGIGGLVTGGGAKTSFAERVVEGTREVIGDRPLHVFGIGTPEAAERVFEAGATSVDSSSYVQAAARGRLWGGKQNVTDPSVTDQVHVALCNLALATETPVPLSTTTALKKRLDRTE